MAKRLIVGLGNPGPEYDGTRHNVGFTVADALAMRTRVDVRRNRDGALYGWGRWRRDEIGIAKPQTWMNRSGLAVEALARRYKLDPVDILIVLDDIHLPLGRIRLRPGGGSGGHNGLQDVIDWLDTDAIPRLRIGIGGEYEAGGQSDYVLSRFEAEEGEIVTDMVETAVKAALSFVSDGIETAMNRHNS